MVNVNSVILKHNKDGTARLFIDNVEIKGVTRFKYVNNIDELPEVELRFTPSTKNSYIIEEQENKVYDQEDAIEFIADELDIPMDRKSLIEAILEAEEDYMRSIGIIDG